MTSGPRRVVIEADGGSRGNPGPAAYGAVLKDAGTGEVLAERGERIGRATNNVAEYRGVIAGLELAAEHAPGAQVEARLDSQLVVEQLSGRWKVKHPDLRALAEQAREVAPAGTTYTWVPRAENGHADRLVNEALDGRETRTGAPAGTSAGTAADAGYRGWSAPAGPGTTLILVRHGVTAHTAAKRFSGGLGGDNPGLSDEGRDQVRAVADWLSPLGERIDAVVASPVRRTRESAEILAAVLEHEVEEEAGFAEMEFGTWDGMTFAEVSASRRDELDAWLGSLDVGPGGGESFRAVEERVLGGLQRVLDRHAGKVVVVVSHVTPIKTLVSHAVDAPLSSVFRMELTPASVSVVTFFGAEDGAPARGPRASLRMYNALPPGSSPFGEASRW